MTLTIKTLYKENAVKLSCLLVIEDRVTPIKRGENKDLNLRNSNMVVAEKKISLDSDQTTNILAIPAIVEPSDQLRVIVLVLLEDKNSTIVYGKQQSL
ncbi:hypothetical protein [Ascidiimonas sp. W6]|uniref:hypothetical protein n=1 Tax=Ascidiimonas meishanensis TaxID=3128903 RepID=UPI0030EB5859